MTVVIKDKLVEKQAGTEYPFGDCKALPKVQELFKKQTAKLFKQALLLDHGLTCPKCTETGTFVSTGCGGNTAHHGLKLNQYQCKHCQSRSRLDTILTASAASDLLASYNNLKREATLAAERVNSPMDRYFKPFVKPKVSAEPQKLIPADFSDDVIATGSKSQDSDVIIGSNMCVDIELPQQSATATVDVTENANSEFAASTPLEKFLVDLLEQGKQREAKLQAQITNLETNLGELTNLLKTYMQETPQTNVQIDSASVPKPMAKPSKQSEVNDGWRIVQKKKQKKNSNNASSNAKDVKTDDAKTSPPETERKPVAKPNAANTTTTTRNNSKQPTNYANAVKATSRTYKPLAGRSKQAVKRLVKSVCKASLKPPMGVTVIYAVVQNTKPFVEASRRRDFNTQRQLLNQIVKYYRIGQYVLMKTLIGNGLVQLFIDAAHEDDVATNICEKGGEILLDTQVQAGEVPSFLKLPADRTRSGKNIVNRACHLYHQAPTLACKTAVLNTYSGTLAAEISNAIISRKDQLTPAYDGYRWILQDSKLVQTEADNDQSAVASQAEMHMDSQANGLAIAPFESSTNQAMATGYPNKRPLSTQSDDEDEAMESPKKPTRITFMDQDEQDENCGETPPTQC